MQKMFPAWVLVVSTLAFSKVKKDPGLGIGDIVGKYKFENHILFKNDHKLDISNIYEPVSLEILPDSTILCVLKMGPQKDMTTGHAKILEIGESKGKKFWVAKWAGMSYPVRTVFSKNGPRLRYEVAFTNTSDEIRYGMKEISEIVQN